MTLELNPGFVPAVALRGEILKAALPTPFPASGDTAAGLPWTREWVDAWLARKKESWNEAAAAYGRLLDLQRPGSEAYPGAWAEAVFGRGKAHLELKELRAAQRDFMRAASLLPHMLAPTLLLGKTYYLEGDRAETERVFEELHRRAPSGEKAALWISLTYCALGDFEKSLEWSGTLTDELSKERIRAECFERLSKLDDAIRSWRRVVAHAPEDVRAQAGLGWSLLRKVRARGDWSLYRHGKPPTTEVDELIAASRAAVRLAPKNLEAIDLERIVSRVVESRRSSLASSRPRAVPSGLQVPRGIFTEVRRLGAGVNTPLPECSRRFRPTARRSTS